MKITYIVGSFPKLSETFILNQIVSLIKSGYEIEIVSLYKSNDEIVHQDVKRYNLKEKTSYIVRNNSTLGFDLNEKLVSALFFTDIIHAHFATEPTDFALKLSKIFDIPFVFTAHAYDIFISPDPMKLRERILSSSRVITISNYNKRYLVELIGKDIEEKIDVIHCGIIPSDFYTSLGTKIFGKKFIFIGRFVEKKGLVYALRAFSEVVKKYPDAEFRIIGNGELLSEISNLVDSLKIGQMVKFLGPQIHTRVIKELHEADILVLPSVIADNGDREGIPIVLMEAHATGLPVISTRHSGISELVEDGKSGFLVPERDIKSLREKMILLLENHKLRIKMGLEGNRIVNERFNHSTEMEKLKLLFNDLVLNKKLVSDIPMEQRCSLGIRIKQIISHFGEFNGDQLRKIGQQIERYDERLKVLDKLIKNLGEAKYYENIVKQKDNNIQQRDEELKKAKETISEYENKFRLKDSHIQQRDEELKKAKETLDEYEINNGNLKKELIALKNQITQRENEINTHVNCIKMIEHNLGEMKEELVEKENKLEYLRESKIKIEEEVIHLKASLDYILQTTTYKIYAKFIKPFTTIKKNK